MENNNDNVLKAMLNMIDREHSIYLSPDIGLIGNSDFEIESHYEIEDLFNPRYRKAEKRGDYFTVVDKDCCKLFEPYINFSSYIYDNLDLVGYLFILKDIQAYGDEPKELFETLGIMTYVPGIVVYYQGHLYINDLVDKNCDSKFEYDSSLRLEKLSIGHNYRLTFMGKSYTNESLDIKNEIQIFKREEK